MVSTAGDQHVRRGRRRFTALAYVTGIACFAEYLLLVRFAPPES
jgi:hypothetical protein